jgi:hypothetical protein
MHMRRFALLATVVKRLLLLYTFPFLTDETLQDRESRVFFLFFYRWNGTDYVLTESFGPVRGPRFGLRETVVLLVRQGVLAVGLRRR